MKKRIFSSHSSHAELTDVNEQELAKDGECPFHYSSKSDTDTPHGDSVPDFIIREQDEDTAVIRSEVSVPIPSAITEKSEEKKAPPKADEPQKQELTPRVRSSGFLVKLYATVIILCILASIAMIFLSSNKRAQPAPSEPETGDTSADDTPSLPNAEADKAPTPLPTEGIYQNGIRGTVTVLSENNGTKSIFNGFAVLEKGYIVTLYEALGDQGGNIRIVTHDGKTYPCEVVSSNASVNLALLKSDAPLEPLNVQSPTSLSVGESIFAVGNLGNEHFSSSLALGEVSYVGRQCTLLFPDGIERKANTVQLSSISSDGIGGCPIFNSSGQVVAISLASTPDTNTSLAYSMDDVMRVLSFLKQGQAPTGDALYTLAFSSARLGILGEQQQKDGLFGVSIKGFSDSSADVTTKLRVGDLIYKIDSAHITGNDSLSAYLEGHMSGDTVEIFVLRGDHRLSFYVILV